MMLKGYKQSIKKTTFVNVSIYRLRYYKTLQFVVAFYSHYEAAQTDLGGFTTSLKFYFGYIFCCRFGTRMFLPQCCRPATKMQRCVKALCTCWVVSFSCSVQYLQSPAAFRLFLPHHLLLSFCKLMIVLIRQIH